MLKFKRVEKGKYYCLTPAGHEVRIHDRRGGYEYDAWVLSYKDGRIDTEDRHCNNLKEAKHWANYYANKLITGHKIGFEESHWNDDGTQSNLLMFKRSEIHVNQFVANPDKRVRWIFYSDILGPFWTLIHQKGNGKTLDESANVVYEKSYSFQSHGAAIEYANHLHNQ